MAGKIIELDNFTATTYPCSYEKYAQAKREEKETQPTPAPIKQNKQTSYRSKEERAQDAQRQTRIKKIEKEISALEEEEAQINLALSTPEITGNFALLTEKCNRLEEIKTLVDRLYAEYETLL